MKSNQNKSAYGIRKHIAFWAVDFQGQTAVFDHEQGVYYVAYLLLNPPSEPIHGMALEIRANAYFGQMPNVPCATFMVDPAKGGILTVGRDAMIVQRGVC